MLTKDKLEFDITQTEKILMVYDKAYAIGFEAGKKALLEKIFSKMSLSQCDINLINKTFEETKMEVKK